MKLVSQGNLKCTTNQGVMNINGACICFAGYSGTTCNFQTSQCSSMCGNGMCMPTNNNVLGYTCSCMPGYTGDNCKSKNLMFEFFNQKYKLSVLNKF